jgi:hypothetical protein
MAATALTVLTAAVSPVDCAPADSGPIWAGEQVSTTGGVIMLHRIASALVAGVLAAGLAGVGSGVAKDVQIGAVTITLPPPEGYCELDASRPLDARTLKVIGDLVAGMQSELLTISTDCSRIEAWRSGQQRILGDNAQYQTPLATKESEFPRAESVREACASYRTEGDSELAKIAPDLTTRLDTAIQGVKFNQPQFLGVLAEDADACYFAMLMKAGTPDGEVVQAIISATTTVKGKIILYNLYALYHDATTVTTMLARHRSNNIPALLAANGG